MLHAVENPQTNFTIVLEEIKKIGALGVDIDGEKDRHFVGCAGFRLTSINRKKENINGTQSTKKVLPGDII